MCVNESETGVTVEVQGADIVKVDDFTYLRSTIQSNRQCTKEVKKKCWQGGDECQG